MITDIRTALCVFAHPDDCELSCLGTIAKLCNAGVEVVVIVLTPGERICEDYSQRLVTAREVAAVVGFSMIEGCFPDGQIVYDIKLVSLVEQHMNKLSPDLVITQYPQDYGTGHQDHIAVSAATTNAALRHPAVKYDSDAVIRAIVAERQTLLSAIQQ